MEFQLGNPNCNIFNGFLGGYIGMLQGFIAMFMRVFGMASWTYGLFTPFGAFMLVSVRIPGDW